MWNMKNTLLFVASIIAVIVISMKMANANPVLNWFEKEKQKTIEYQTKAWAESKEDFSNFVKKFGLLSKKKDESHN
tara:strand:+ start:80 stop:307 length:228 start_codon:yes stop_codon:yes gene_type:complete